MLKIFLHHFISYVSGTPNSVTNGPKMSSPISFAKFWVFLLESPRSSALQPFYNITNILRWSIFYVDMHMIFTYDSFKNTNIFSS